MKRRRAGVHGDRMFSTQMLCEFLLKFDGARTFCNPEGFQCLIYRVPFRLGQVRKIIWDKIISFSKIAHIFVLSYLLLIFLQIR